jgi:hypothetical protein
MEKWIVFGPMILFFGFFALLIIGFLMLVGKLLFKAKADAWVGEVIDKGHIIKDKDDSNQKEHLYHLKVQFENGEIHAIPATVQFYNEIKVGDKLKKEKGALWPKKI